jgi:hypothetical protein
MSARRRRIPSSMITARSSGLTAVITASTAVITSRNTIALRCRVA